VPLLQGHSNMLQVDYAHRVTRCSSCRADALPAFQDSRCELRLKIGPGLLWLFMACMQEVQLRFEMYHASSQPSILQGNDN
jgi:hypothetical protein